MKVAVLRDAASEFAVALRQGWSSGLEALYESIPHWQTAWPPATADELAATLDAALRNNRTRAFWQGHAYFPKEAITTLAAHTPEMMNLAFGRLFNEDLDLAQRYSQFVFYLDECLEQLRRTKPHTKLGTHYHDDYRMPSLYCALNRPAQYAYFEHETYSQGLRVLEARDISPAPDPERFAKSTKVVMTFLAKTEGLEEAHRQRLTPEDYAETSALLASEYFRFLAS